MGPWHEESEFGKRQQRLDQQRRDEEDQLELERRWADERQAHVCDDMGHPIRERLGCRCGYRRTIIL